MRIKIIITLVLFIILIFAGFLGIKYFTKIESINLTEQNLLEGLLLENYWPSQDLTLYKFDHPNIANRDLYKSYWTIDGINFEAILFFNKKDISELILSFSVINNNETMDNEKAKDIARNFSRIILNDWKCETNETINFCETSWVENDKKTCIDFEYPIDLQDNIGIYNFHIYRIIQEENNHNLEYCRDIYQK